MTDTVTAVVLSWNGRADTLRCLASLEQATYPGLGVVVVDNGSTDGTVEAVATGFPGARVVALTENTGFAGGVNAGAAAALQAGADHVLLLNNDTTVDPGFVEPLVSAAADPTVAAACSQILDEHGERIWYAGGRYDPARGYQGRMQGYGEKPLPPGLPAYATERACGGAMLVPAHAWRSVGPLDDDLFAYVEDVEWSLRARRDGLRIVVAPASVVRHRVSAASGGAASPLSMYYTVRNSLVVGDRWAPAGSLARARRHVVTVAAASAQAVLAGGARGPALRAVVAAWNDARKGVLGRKDFA